MNFLNFISNVQSWQDFRNALNSQSVKTKGDAFEYLTKYTLQFIPRYKAKLKKVWLSNELPPSKRKHFRQPTRDIGIDLYAETYDGEYWAIQCKYHSDESRSVTHTELSTFMSDAFVKGANLDHGLVCTNANRYSKYLEDGGLYVF